MTQRVGVAIAARMLGVPRSTLQRLIRDGKLACFDGQVDVAELNQRYPGLIREEPLIVEQVRTLRQTAFGRRVRDVAAPDHADPEVQVRRLSSELDIEKLAAKRYREILDDLARKLGHMQAGTDPEQRLLAEELCLWLHARLDQ